MHKYKKNDVIAFYKSNDDKLNDIDIIRNDIQPQDFNADYLQGRDTYCWYYSLASIVRPRVIAEIGSRFGYSLKAMILGAEKFTDSYNLIIFSFDNESYEKNCSHKIDKMLSNTKTRHLVQIKDTQNCNVLPLQFNECEKFKADLFHVDGDHSIQGTYHDLLLAKEQLNDDGVILLDDIDTQECPGVKAAMMLFLGDYPEFKWDYFPSYRGLAAIYKD